MAEYDGTIRIGVKMDGSGIDKDAESLRKKLSAQLKDIERQGKAVERLQKAYDKLANAGAPKGVKTLEADLKRAQAEAAGLDAEFQRLRQMSELDTAAYGKVSPETEEAIREVSERMREADARADGLARKLEALRMPPESTEEAQRLAERLNAAKDHLEETRQAANRTATELQGMSGAAQDWPRAVAEMASRMGKAVTGAVKSSAAALTHLKKRVSSLGREKGFERAGRSAEQFGRRLKSLVAGAVFFNVISRGLTELTQQIGKYLNANQEFSNALSGIRDNLLTAFQPVYEAIIPALTALMEALESVTAKFAVFMATIFGTTAEKAQENAEALKKQAEATEEAGDAAEEAKEQQKEAEKEQKKYLASFDTIEKLGEDQKKEEEEEKKEDEQEKPEFDTDFSEIQAPQWLLDFWKVFKDGWEQYGAPVMEAFRTAVQKIKDLIASLWDAFLSVWTGGVGLEFLGNIAGLLQTIFGIVGDIAAAFKTAWDRRGEEVIAALFYMLNSVLELIISIGESFREAWNDGYGVAICETILEIFRDIFLIVGNLAERLREAWEANGNGEAIWRAILSILHIVLSTIQRVTAATVEWARSLDLEPLVSGIRGVLESLVPVVSIIGDTIVSIWKDTVLPFLSWLLEEALPGLLDKLSSLLDYLARNPEIIQELTRIVMAFIAAWQLGGIIGNLAALASKLDPVKIILLLIMTLLVKLAAESEPFREALGGAFESLGELLKSLLELFKELWPVLEPLAETIGVILVSAVKTLADALGFLVDILTSAIQGIKNFNDWANRTSTSNKYKTSEKGRNSGGGVNLARSASIPTAYSAAALMERIPRLAGGAVIAPNHEFLAVLGDQRSGTNVETPLSTMKQAFLEAISESGLLDQQSGGGGAEMYLEGQKFAQLIYPYLQQERSRLGVNLVGGGY